MTNTLDQKQLQVFSARLWPVEQRRPEDFFLVQRLGLHRVLNGA
jgi:hypothetical protein